MSNVRPAPFARLGLAATAALLAGCHLSTPGMVEGRVSTSRPVSNGGGALAQGSLDAPVDGGSLAGRPAGQAGGATAGSPATGDAPISDKGGAAKPPVVTVPVSGDASAAARDPLARRDAALAGAGATRARVDAATGAVIATPDGKLSLTIPPGALTADADVRVAPIDTSHLPVPHVVLPGIRFALDLGGAKIAPDQAIKVRQVVDPRFVPALQARDQAFDPANYGLTKDASGTWVMEMPVRGPASRSPQVPTEPVSIEQILLAEFGHLPFAPGPASQPRFKLQATPEEMFESTYGQPAPKSMDEWYAYEDAGTFDCVSIESNCWGLQLLSGLGFPLGANASCGIAGSPPPSPNGLRVGVPAEVTFTSDDSDVHGKPAGGATVTFQMMNAAVNGPAQVVADADGRASTFAVEGSPVSAMAEIAVGPRAGGWVNGTARSGMAPLKLTVEKNSPHVNLTFRVEGLPLGEKLELAFTVDGQVRKQEVTFQKPAASEETFMLITKVPDDELHDFAVTGALGANYGFKRAVPGTLKVQRNGTYDVLVELVPNASK